MINSDRFRTDIVFGDNNISAVHFTLKNIGYMCLDDIEKAEDISKDPSTARIIFQFKNIQSIDKLIKNLQITKEAMEE